MIYIYIYIVLVWFIRSVLVFEMQRSTDELIIGMQILQFPTHSTNIATDSIANYKVNKGIRSCSNTRAFEPDKLSILDPEELNTSLHSSTTPSHLVGFRRFGSHPNPETSRGLFSLHILLAYYVPLSSSDS